MIHTFKGNSSLEDFCSQDDIDIKEVIFFLFQAIKDDVSFWNRYDERNKNKKRRRRPLYGQKQSYTLCAKPFMFGKAVAMIFDQSLPNYHSKLLVVSL